MEIEREKLLDFLLWLWGIVEKNESDLLAHEVVFLMLKASGQVPQPQLDQLLKQARENPSPLLQKRHRETRETLVQLLSEQKPEDALMTFLRNWKPRGPIQ